MLKKKTIKRMNPKRKDEKGWGEVLFLWEKD